MQNMPPLPERTSRNATPEIKERILPGHQEKGESRNRKLNNRI